MTHRVLNTLRVITSPLLLLGIATSSHALEGSYSNHQPGIYGDFFVAVAPPRGFAAALDTRAYSADTTEHYETGRVDIDFEYVQTALELSYAGRGRLARARWATFLFIPVVHADESQHLADIYYGDESLSAERTAIGDAYVIPLSLFWKHRRYHLNLYEGISIPIGRWKEDRLANPGSNYWSFDSKAALTWWNRRRGIELSAVAGHTYNTKNRDTDYHSGQELHLDLMANRHFRKRFSLGIRGFHQRQITDDHGSGADLGGFRVNATGFGPSLRWSPQIAGGKWSVILGWLHEVSARNRPTGEHLSLELRFSAGTGRPSLPHGEQGRRSHGAEMVPDPIH